MIERIIYKKGRQVVEVRSRGGKLLFIKSKDGYEIKCRKTQEICIVSYDHMFLDSLKSFLPFTPHAEVLRKSQEIRRSLISSLSA